MKYSIVALALLCNFSYSANMFTPPSITPSNTALFTNKSFSGTTDFKLGTNQHIQMQLDGGLATVTGVNDAGALNNLQFDAGSEIDFAISGNQGMIYTNSGLQTAIMRFNTSLKLGPLIVYSTIAPTVSGMGTGASVTNYNGTSAFIVNVGTGGTANSGTIMFTGVSPSPTGWVCNVNNLTTATSVTKMTAYNSTTVTINNYALSTGIATAWAASSILAISCNAF